MDRETARSVEQYPWSWDDGEADPLGRPGPWQWLARAIRASWEWLGSLHLERLPDCPTCGGPIDLADPPVPAFGPAYLTGVCVRCGREVPYAPTGWWTSLD
jgi:hypothetical protein